MNFRALIILFQLITAAYSINIELLRVDVPAKDVDRFIRNDRNIWTSFLKIQPGFVSKQVLVPYQSSNSSLLNPEEIIGVYTLIHWESLQLWKQIPEDQLKQVQDEFARVMGYDPPLTALGAKNGFGLIPAPEYVDS
jgi:uncharacterized protein (TIGR03792 family)